MQKKSLDALSILKQSIVNKKDFCVLPYSSLNTSLCSCLYKNGYISSYRFVKNPARSVLNIFVSLKSSRVIQQIRLISSGKSMVFASINKLNSFSRRRATRSIYLIATNKGVLCSNDIFNNNVGGLILAKIN